MLDEELGDVEHDDQDDDLPNDDIGLIVRELLYVVQTLLPEQARAADQLQITEMDDNEIIDGSSGGGSSSPPPQMIVEEPSDEPEGNGRDQAHDEQAVRNYFLRRLQVLLDLLTMAVMD